MQTQPKPSEPVDPHPDQEEWDEAMAKVPPQKFAEFVDALIKLPPVEKKP